MTVQLRGVCKSFSGVVALDDINLTIQSNEFLALLGPSGSGKTTLLRVLAGLEFAETGEIVIGQRSMSDIPARERGIGFVFQQYALFRHMTVARNVAFGLDVLPRPRRPSPAQIQQRVRELLSLMEIDHLAERYPEQISGGQRQRVALARALATEPRLLLLDEPFGALDAKVRKSLRIWLRRLHEQMELTSVFVTHDQAEAMEMADRIAVLRAGRIEQLDTPERLYAEPANAFVHEFMGESVQFDCQVHDGQAFVAGGMMLPAHVPSGPGLVVIRPHEIDLRPGPGPAWLEAVHTTGPMRRLLIRIGDQLIEVLRPETAWLPDPSTPFQIDLSRGRVYSKAGAA